VHAVFDPLRSVSRRSTYGGTAPEAVRAQIEEARQNLD
jgi:argininosuccinate lyase